MFQNMQIINNCKCRKKLADKLVKECTENIDEVKITSKNEHKNKYSSCILYIGTGAYFVYYKYMNRDKETASRYDYVYQTTI